MYLITLFMGVLNLAACTHDYKLDTFNLKMFKV